MEIKDIFEISAYLSTTLGLVGIFILLLQFIKQNKEIKFEIANKILNELEDKDFTNNVKGLYTIKERLNDPNGKVVEDNLQSEDSGKLNNAILKFELLAMKTKEHKYSRELLIKGYYYMIIRLSQISFDYIEDQRKKRELPEYRIDFDQLFIECKKYQLLIDRKDIKRKQKRIPKQLTIKELLEYKPFRIN